MTPIKAAADTSREALAKRLECSEKSILRLSGRSMPMRLNAVERDLIVDALRAAPAGNAGVRRYIVRKENSDNLCGMTAWGECWSVIDAPDGPDAVTAKWVGFFIDQTSAETVAAALSLPQPREAFADEIKRADAAPPITNPLVLPAGIKAGDYASRSPIPEEPVGRKIAPTDLNKVWQSAEACWASSAPDEAVDTLYYEILRLIGHPVTGFDINDVSAPTKRALKPQYGGNCEHGIAKVNCGICVPSKVFSGGSGR